jgi:hypothetical protein
LAAQELPRTSPSLRSHTEVERDDRLMSARQSDFSPVDLAMQRALQNRASILFLKHDRVALCPLFSRSWL